MNDSPTIQKIAFIGDHLPRKCGIATFTSDLLAAVQSEHPESRCLAVSVNDIKDGYEYPEVVRFEVEEQDLSSYLRAADFLNISNVDVVCLQHEFGIFGGPAGGHILALLRELRMPVVTTLHTILREPRADQRRVMEGLISLSTRLVVMAERGRRMLHELYQVPLAKIDLIPHGIPDVGFVDPTYFKDQFGVEGKVVLLTFGLLSPNKGIEHVLNALPRILAEFPEVVYIVLGATHPNEVREHGEAYRLSLEILARRNKIDKSVIFYNQFVDLDSLKEFIGAADLYVTPYLNEAQITSGTLAYTFGSGKAVISTPYWHAAELLADDRGILVPFGDAPAIAREVIGLLRDDTRRHSMRKNAYKIGREMIWSNVAQMYMRAFESSRLEAAARSHKSPAIKTLDLKPRDLPKMKLNHLSRMTDSTGVFQHAVVGRGVDRRHVDARQQRGEVVAHARHARPHGTEPGAVAVEAHRRAPGRALHAAQPGRIVTRLLDRRRTPRSAPVRHRTGTPATGRVHAGSGRTRRAHRGRRSDGARRPALRN
jgi:glycosyltransferase involved in cell wall biosynthesis